MNPVSSSRRYISDSSGRRSWSTAEDTVLWWVLSSVLLKAWETMSFPPGFSTWFMWRRVFSLSSMCGKSPKQVTASKDSKGRLNFSMS